MRLDRGADVAQPGAGLCRLDPQHQAFVGHIDQALRLQRNVADIIHPAGIAVPAIEQGGYVDVDDIAVLQRLLARNTVADHMVDRDAAAMRIAAIPHRRGHRAPGQRAFAHEIVERRGGDARHHQFFDIVEDAGGELPRPPHAFEPFGAVKLDGTVADDGLCAVDDLVLTHAGLHSGLAARLRGGYFFNEKASRYSGFTALSIAASTSKSSL